MMKKMMSKRVKQEIHDEEPETEYTCCRDNTDVFCG